MRKLKFILILALLLCVCFAALGKSEKDEWSLMLVNRDNPIPEDYRVGELVQLRGGHSVDERILPDLQRMFDDARAEGIDPIVCSGYRTQERQRELLMEKYKAYLAEGHKDAEAQQLALAWVAYPGTSEHQVGFAIDVSGQNGTTDQQVYDWLGKNAWKYGFILRYPEDKTEITKTIYEPWHFRYVGQYAEEIYKSGLCLEEWLAQRDD